MPLYSDFIPMRPRTGFVDVDDGGTPPENSIRMTPDPLGDIKRRAFMSARQKSPEEQQAEFEAWKAGKMTGRTPSNNQPAIDLTDRDPNDKFGRPLVGRDLARFTGTGAMSGDQWEIVKQMAVGDPRYSRTPMTASIGGQSYTMTPRMRVNDARSQEYLRLAEQERLARVAENDKALALKDKERQQRIDDAERERKIEEDRLNRRDKRMADFRTRSREEEDDYQKRIERGMTNRMNQAKLEQFLESQTPSGRDRAKREKLYESLLNSTDPRQRIFAQQRQARMSGVEDADAMFTERYPDKLARVKPEIDAYTRSITSGYGAQYGEDDAQRAQMLFDNAIERGRAEGMTEEELNQLRRQLGAIRQGQGFFPALGKTLTLDF